MMQNLICATYDGRDIFDGGGHYQKYDIEKKEIDVTKPNM